MQLNLGELLKDISCTSGARSNSINFVMRADALEQDGFFTLVLHELENYAQIVTGAARPGSHEFAFEFMRLELRMKCVLRQKGQHRLKLRSRLRMLAGKPTAGTNERSGWQKQPFQAKMRLTI